MADRYIAGLGAYLPLLRFDRAAASRALRFSGLNGRGKGRRAVAGWDEDALTLAVEAGRALDLDGLEQLVFASTSAPFYDRSHAGLIGAALGLPEDLRSNDVAGSRRCATSALLDALLSGSETLVVAGERRDARPGSPQHLSYGDAGAAARVGGSGAARLIGWASRAHDLLDSYTSRLQPTPYAYEERFVRDTSPALMLDAVRAACMRAEITADRIAHAAVHTPLPGMWPGVAKALRTSALDHGAAVDAAAGDLGSAHALFALGLALDAARPGEIVLLLGFGSGCDALLFEVTGAVPGAATAGSSLTQGVSSEDYAHFLSLTGAIDLDWGVRSEFGQKSQATVAERHGRDMFGFVGGRDAAGNVQFPKSGMPVRPGATGPEPMADVRLADCSASLASVTADRLNFTPDPPFWFGLVQFDNGARVLMELTDAGPAGFAVGDPLGMRFRIKALDRQRGMRTYFWKAAPAVRPQLETA